jgi:hypothetical protein
MISCDKLVTNIDPPKTEKELVMFSFLSPEDTAVKVELSYSSPVFGTTSFGEVEYIKDAIVTISEDGGRLDTLVYNLNDGLYSLSGNNIIKPGKTYQVTSIYEGKKAVGSTTIPTVIVTIDTVNILEAPSSNGEMLSKVKTTWKDPGQNGLFYRVYNEQVYSFGGGDSSSYGACSDFISNFGKENNKFTSVCEIGSNWIGSENILLNVYLLTTDKHYYEYHRRRVNYFGDDPFSEPIPQYANVKGGIGVIASYRKTKITLK